jgi:acetyl esterase/lipase
MDESRWETLALWPDEQVPDDERPPLRWRTHPAGAMGDGRPVVLVLPGGGYRVHAGHEAEPVAERFGQHGCHGAVLRYRCGPGHGHPEPLHDAQRAVRVLRRHTGGRSAVVVVGFSAGGHLAATLATRHGEAGDERDDLAEASGSFSGGGKPDAVVLGYPVVDFADMPHLGSMRTLLGERADDVAWRERLSPQLHVTAGSPPAFLWHTAEDAGVPPRHSEVYHAACRAAGVASELVVYPHGPHGLGLGDGGGGHEALADVAGWPEKAVGFLRRVGVLDGSIGGLPTPEGVGFGGGGFE